MKSLEDLGYKISYQDEEIIQYTKEWEEYNSESGDDYSCEVSIKFWTHSYSDYIPDKSVCFEMYKREVSDNEYFELDYFFNFEEIQAIAEKTKELWQEE